MKEKNLIILARIYFIWIGTSHFLVGVFGALSDFQSSDSLLFRIADFMWNSSINFTPQYYLVTKLLLSYVAGFGLSLLLLAINPKKFRIFIWFPIVTLVLEIIGMIVYFNNYINAFNINRNFMVWNLVQSIILLSLFIFFYLMLGRGKR